MKRRTFANIWARNHYSRDWLAAHLARHHGTTFMVEARKLNGLKRDDLIARLRNIMNIDKALGCKPSSSIRAGYIKERHARLIDRAQARQLCADTEGVAA